MKIKKLVTKANMQEGRSIAPSQILVHAMMHLEYHHKFNDAYQNEKDYGISIYKIAQLDFPDYAAIRILDAAREIIRFGTDDRARVFF